MIAVGVLAPQSVGVRRALTLALTLAAILLPAPGSSQSSFHPSLTVESGGGSFVGGAALGAFTGVLAGASFLTLKANVFDGYMESSVSDGLREFLPWLIGGAAVGAISIATGEGAGAGQAVGPAVRAAVAGAATGAAVGVLSAALASLGSGEFVDELPGGAIAGALIGLGAGALVGTIDVFVGPGEDHDGWRAGAWGAGIAAVPLFYWSVRF